MILHVFMWFTRKRRLVCTKLEQYLKEKFSPVVVLKVEAR